MSDAILLHPKTGRRLDSLLKNPAHALMITGPAGAGKKTIAEYIAANLLNVSLDKLRDQPFFIELIKPTGKSEIPIELVRELIRGLRLKTTGRRRIVIVNEAHDLSEEAQNALLKAIEEPPPETIFILTTLSSASVLPTIASRSQTLSVFPSHNEDARLFFKSFSTTEVDSAWQLSRGAAGLMSAILEQNNAHAVKQAVDQAKLFLRMDRFERLVFLDRLTTDKVQLTIFIDALERVCAALSDICANRQQKSQLVKLTAARRRLNEALDSLGKNVSARLVVLDLALSLNL